MRKRIVGVVVEAPVAPLGIKPVRDLRLELAPATKGGHMAIANLIRCHPLRQHLDVELKIAARTRKASEVQNQADLCRSEDVHELFWSLVQVTDCAEARCHL